MERGTQNINNWNSALDYTSPANDFLHSDCTYKDDQPGLRVIQTRKLCLFLLFCQREHFHEQISIISLHQLGSVHQRLHYFMANTWSSVAPLIFYATDHFKE